MLTGGVGSPGPDPTRLASSDATREKGPVKRTSDSKIFGGAAVQQLRQC